MVKNKPDALNNIGTGFDNVIDAWLGFRPFGAIEIALFDDLGFANVVKRVTNISTPHEVLEPLQKNLSSTIRKITSLNLGGNLPKPPNMPDPADIFK